MSDLRDLEANFITALEAFTRYSDGDDQFRSDLFVAYHRLLSFLPKVPPQSRDNTLKQMFLALMEQLDGTPDGILSEVLYLYAFRDFLESYGHEPAVQAAIQEFLSVHAFCKLPLKIALARRQTDTAL